MTGSVTTIGGVKFRNGREVVSRRGLRPFLKWVGGKRQLLPVLRRFYPDSFGTYHEPFLGSGAVYFDLVARGALNGRDAVLSDANADLIAAYRRVARSLDEVMARLEIFKAEHAVHGRDNYLRIRDQHFNPLRVEWRARGANLDDYSSELAAMLIYLNRTGYNGLFRQNSSGEYNVPPGKYDRPRVIDRVLLTRVSEAFNRPGVQLDHGSFDRVLDRAVAGDFVYFDPPYAPLSHTANFRGYTGRGFSMREQERLQSIVIELARRGVHVLLSNSVTEVNARLYEGNAEIAAAGLRTFRYPARRSVNSRPDRRGTVEELVVSSLADAIKPQFGDAQSGSGSS